MKKMALALVMGILIMFLLSNSANAWQDSSFIKCKPLTINLSSGNLSNITATINVTYASDMLANFSDIRFSNLTSCNETFGEWIGQYLINKTDSQFANWEVLIPSVNATITMYYGNAGASLVSNRRDSNLFWDDFSEGIINTTLWYENTTSGTATVANNMLNLIANSNGEISYCTNSKFPIPIAFEYDAAPQLIANAIQFMDIPWWFGTNPTNTYNGFILDYNGNWRAYVYETNVSTADTTTVDVWYHYMVTGTDSLVNIYANNTGSMVSQTSTTPATTDSTMFCIASNQPSGWNAANTNFTNIRGYTYTMGIVSYLFGAEENHPYTLPTVNLISPINGNLTNGTSATMTFNCSAIISAGANLVNMTLFGNWSGGWHANETKIVTGTNNSSIFSKSLPAGTYIWNCQACNNLSECSFGTSNSFTIQQYFFPSISISSPSGFYDNWNVALKRFNDTWTKPLTFSNNTALVQAVYSIDGGANYTATSGSILSIDAMKHNITVCGQNIIGEWGCDTDYFEVNGGAGKPKILFNYTLPNGAGMIIPMTDMIPINIDGDSAIEVAVSTYGNDASVWVLDNCTEPSCLQPYLPPRIVGYAKTDSTQINEGVWRMQVGDMGGSDGVLNELCVGTGYVPNAYIRCYKWNGTWYEENVTISLGGQNADVESLEFCDVNNNSKAELIGALYNSGGGGGFYIVQNYTDIGTSLGGCRAASAISCQDVNGDGIKDAIIGCDTGNIQYLSWNGTAYIITQFLGSSNCASSIWFRGDDNNLCDYGNTGNQSLLTFCGNGTLSYMNFNDTSVINVHQLSLTASNNNMGGKIINNLYPTECSIEADAPNKTGSYQYALYRNSTSSTPYFIARPFDGTMNYWLFPLGDIRGTGYSQVGYFQYDGSAGAKWIQALDFSQQSIEMNINWNTPANNSFTLNLSSILWNASISDTPNACILNINGTANYSMLISGNDCYYTTSNLTNQTTYCGTIYANNSASNVSNMRCATINLTSGAVPPTPRPIDNLGIFGGIALLVLGAGIILFLLEGLFGAGALLRNPKGIMLVIIGAIIMAAMILALL